jgi:hypothetical protein
MAVRTAISFTPCGGGGLGQGIAHLAAGAVGDVAHRVERLLRGTGRHQHRFALQVAWPQQTRDVRGDDFRVRQTPRAGHAAGQVAAAGFHDGVPALAQNLQVGARGGVLPHVYVHGGRHHHRADESQVHRGEKIVGQPMGHLGHQVGRRRSDRQDLVLLGHGDVFDGALDGEQVGEHFAPGQRGKREGPDEFLRGRGHDDADLMVLLHEQTRQLRGFVGRYTSTDPQDDLHGRSGLADLGVNARALAPRAPFRAPRP